MTNKEIVQELINTFQSGDDLGKISTFICEDVIWSTEDHLFGRDSKDIQELQEHVPFIGKHVGRKAVLTMLNKLKANFGDKPSEMPKIIGAPPPDDSKQLVYDNKAKVTYQVEKTGETYNFESPFALVITFGEGLIIYVELIYDTYTLTRASKT